MLARWSTLDKKLELQRVSNVETGFVDQLLLSVVSLSKHTVSNTSYHRRLSRAQRFGWSGRVV